MVVGTPQRQRSNLPVDVNSFVGRRRELAEVRRLVSSYRLVTLTGVGGVGKTRLSIQSAREMQRAFSDGVFLIELAGLSDPSMVPHAVAATLGLRDLSPRGVEERLAEHLADKQRLIVLDNCEHLVDACATLVSTLLRACPDLRVIATSREPLGVVGECTMPVPTLTVPNGKVYPPEALLQFESVRLFVDRVTAVIPEFEVVPENASALAGICRRLDGIPLAIELAAVRLRALSIDEVLDRLEDRFRLLTTGSRAALPRQQTLRALVDWSYDLMSADEQLLWARLSVFAGSFELDAVEGVCADQRLAADSVVDIVASLVDKSVVARDQAAGLTRYRLLDTIQSYGRERLVASGEEDELRRRHRDWYDGLFARAEAELFGPDQVAWFSRLRAEHLNLRTAVDFCVAADEATEGLRIAAALQHYWIMNGSFSEGRSWLHRLLDRHADPDMVRCRALALAGRLAVLQGDVEEGRALLAEARPIAAVAGDQTWLANIAHAEGLAALFWGDPASAVARFQDALEGHREGGDPFGVALALVQLASGDLFTGDTAAAAVLCDECLALSAKNQEHWCAALALFTQALSMWRQGDHRRAQELASECIRRKGPFGDRMGMAMAMEVLAWVACEERQQRRAAQLLGAVHAAWGSIGAEPFGHLAADRERCVRKLRRELGDKGYESAHREGEYMGFDEAVAFALGEKREAGPTRTTGHGPALTRRESEIAELIAEGLTNKEIAARLVIAQRTAEGHVENILSKLGFASRAQVAAWVAERRGSSAPGRD